MVENLPPNAGDEGSIPVRGQIPHAMGQLNPHAATREACLQHSQ